jgi:hypothetical protein
MFAPALWQDSQQSEFALGPREAAFHKKFRSRGSAVRPHAILDGDAALFILAERRINHSLRRTHVAMHDGNVFFMNRATLPYLPQRPSALRIFGHENDTAGFAIKPIHQVQIRFRTQM